MTFFFFLFAFWWSLLDLLSCLSSCSTGFLPWPWLCPDRQLPSPVSSAKDVAHSLVFVCLLQPPQGQGQYHWALSVSATVSTIFIIFFFSLLTSIILLERNLKTVETIPGSSWKDQIHFPWTMSKRRKAQFCSVVETRPCWLFKLHSEWHFVV